MNRHLVLVTFVTLSFHFILNSEVFAFANAPDSSVSGKFDFSLSLPVMKGRSECDYEFSRLAGHETICLSARLKNAYFSQKITAQWATSVMAGHRNERVALSLFESKKRLFWRDKIVSFESDSALDAQWVRSLISRVLMAVQRERESISNSLKSSDTNGVLLSLILDDRSHSRTHGLIRELGFVHLLNETGVHLWVLVAWCWAMVFWFGQFFRLSVERSRQCAAIVGTAVGIYSWALCRIHAHAIAHSNRHRADQGSGENPSFLEKAL